MIHFKNLRIKGFSQKCLQIVKNLVEAKHMQVERQYPGLTCFLDGVRMVTVESIPGVIETGWIPSTRATRNTRVTEESTDSEVLVKHLKKVLNFVSKIVYMKLKKIILYHAYNFIFSLLINIYSKVYILTIYVLG